MNTTRQQPMRRWRMLGAMVGGAALLLVTDASSQAVQRVEVQIKNFTFVTKQVPLRLGVPTVIVVENKDRERHDFGSTMFQGVPTQIATGGVVSYGRGIGGVFIDPGRGTEIHFTMDRPGRHEFRCSIHPNMKGELLLLNVEAV